MRFLLLNAVLLLITACTTSTPHYPPSITHPYLNKHVFTFEATHYNVNDSLVYRDTVQLQTMGKPWPTEPVQAEINWCYSSVPRKVSTGVLVKKDSIWLHPPRSHAYRILEANAFPAVHYALSANTQWRGQVFTNASWFNNYPDLRKKLVQETIKIEHQYTVLQRNIMPTQFGPVSVTKIEGKSSSDLGATTALFDYTDDYGFIRLDFTTCIGSRIILNLIRIDAQPINAYL